MGKEFLDDERLVECIQMGGSERKKALAQIFHSPGLKQRVINYVVYNGGSVDEGEGVFTECILIVDKNVRHEKYKGHSTLVTYTYGVAKNYWANKRRLVKKKLVELDKGYNDLSDYQNPELIFIEKELATKLNHILSLLTKKCQTVLKLWSNDVSYEEIGKELEIEKTASLRKLKYDCQQKLKEALLQNTSLIPNYYNAESRR
ncbi:RNA polymerase sigma factor [Portibacter lacus]|uniref:Sigma-70 family RNA polymerase sigma factor n=1 Tax=Portibacter lacus TaxID=1099794 RepID=A0AA37SNF8_9BACT|nr:sigma-70 family RNA polymerase sigma factor [Portibacter lacus]GLR17963.1 hypothetical protein GCM10007940_25780 [Portibacter lacus]